MCDVAEGQTAAASLFRRHRTQLNLDLFSRSTPPKYKKLVLILRVIWLKIFFLHCQLKIWFHIEKSSLMNIEMQTYFLSKNPSWVRMDQFYFPSVVKRIVLPNGVVITSSVMSAWSFTPTEKAKLFSPQSANKSTLILQANTAMDSMNIYDYYAIIKSYLLSNMSPNGTFTEWH